MCDILNSTPGVIRVTLTAAVEWACMTAPASRLQQQIKERLKIEKAIIRYIDAKGNNKCH